MCVSMFACVYIWCACFCLSVSLSVFVSVCVCVRERERLHAYACVFVCVCAYVFASVCVCLCAHVWIWFLLCSFLCNSPSFAPTLAYIVMHRACVRRTVSHPLLDDPESRSDAAASKQQQVEMRLRHLGTDTAIIL